MSGKLKPAAAVVAVLIALMTAALVACDREPTPTPTPESSVTAVPSASATPEPTATPTVNTPTPAPTPTPQPTATPVVSTPTPAPTPIPQPTATPVVSTPTPAPQPTPAPTATPEPTPTPTPTPDTSLPFDPKVVRGTLSNGLSYYIRHNEEPPDRAQIALVVKAGSVHEEEHQQGLAHFVEHMAFNGTDRFAKQEIVEYLESIGNIFGPDVNAQTGFDDTRYWLELPTDDPEITETAFRILSDWAYGISFDPEEVDLERGVVLEEWRLSQGFSSRLQDSLLQLIFGSSLYANRAPIGLPEVVEGATAELLREYYKRWYHPDLMAVVAVGDFDVEEMEAKVRQHFAPPPEGEASQESAAVGTQTDRPSVEVPGHETPWINVFTDAESPGSQFILIRKLAPGMGQDQTAFRRFVVQRLAFMMMNARLFERGQVEDPPYLGTQALRSSYVESLDIQQFAAWVAPGGIVRGLEVVLEELQRVRLHGFTEGELEREKSNLLRSVESVYKQRDQVPSQNFVNEYVHHFLTGTPAPGIEAEWELYQEVLPQITLDEFVEVAVSWTKSHDTALLVVRPAETEAASDSDLNAATLALLEAAPTLEVAPYADVLEDVPLLDAIPTPGSITAEEHIESIDAQKWTLSNGITVIAKQTDFRDDEVEFRAFSPGGHSLVADADHVSALHAAQMIAGSGVGPHDNVALDKLLAGKRVSVFPFIGELFEGFSGRASPEDMETLFQLITLYATQPRLDQAIFDRYQVQMQSIAEVNAAQPDSVLFDTARTVLAQEHFRRRSLTVELLEELSKEQAEAVYADRFSDLGDATFVFVGAFDWENLRSLSATYLASLPTTGRAEDWVDHNIDPPSGVEDHVVHSGIEPRSNTVLAFAGDMDWSREEALALNVAGEMLGIRLRERVREQLGGTYFIGVNAGSSTLPDAEYLASVIFGSDPTRVEELFEEVLVEVEWIREGGEQSYLDTVKEQMRTSRQENLRENGFWVGQILAVVQRGEAFTEILGFDETLEALTLDDVAATAQRYFTPDMYVRVVLYPVEEE